MAGFRRKLAHVADACSLHQTPERQVTTKKSLHCSSYSYGLTPMSHRRLGCMHSCHRTLEYFHDDNLYRALCIHYNG